MSMLRACLGAIGLCAAAAYLGAPLAIPTLAEPIVKAVPVLCLAAWVSIGRRASARRLTTAGLLCSAVGDALLDLGAATFVPGMLAFLSAHVCYAVAFHRRAERIRPAVGVLCVVWGVSAYLLVAPRLADLAVPVAIYVAVICAMMWRACAAAFDAPSAHRFPALCGAVGAVAFGLSDTLLAFGKWGGPVTAGPLAVMGLYWVGQMGIAGSAKGDGAQTG